MTPYLVTPKLSEAFGNVQECLQEDHCTDDHNYTLMDIPGTSEV